MAALLGLPRTGLLTLPNLVRQSAFWHQTRRTQDINLVNTNFSPFLGLAWDPGKNGKMKLAVAAGRHYNKPAL